MSTFDYEIKDRKGNPVEAGDKIKILLHAAYAGDIYYGECSYDRPAVWVEAKVYLTLSSGLFLKITKILEEDANQAKGDFDHFVMNEYETEFWSVGQKIGFRYTVREYELIEKALP